MSSVTDTPIWSQDPRLLPTLLTLREVAEVLRIGRKTVERWVSEGRIQPVRLTGSGAPADPRVVVTFEVCAMKLCRLPAVVGSFPVRNADVDQRNDVLPPIPKASSKPRSRR
jgi:excisionase family DNA binding protein